MKKLFVTAFIFLIVFNYNKGIAQEMSEKYGKTLNAGLGLGYYGYAGRSMPVLHADYEFDIAKNFTLAPSISFYSYRRSYYWGDFDHPFRYYDYRETVIPIGVKGTYYFDQLFRAGSDWDFYAAGSLGITLVNTSWDSGYYGNKNVYSSPNFLFLDVHAGAEYHLNMKTGLFLDLSSGVSTFGLAVHL